MSESITSAFIRAIPKTDLHVHLDGSLRLATLVEMARASRVRLPSQDPQGLRELVFKGAYASLTEYLAGFALTCAALDRPEHLERAACELGEDALAEGVRYLEVRFAPQLHVRDDLPYAELVRAVCRGLDRAGRAHNGTAAVRSGDDIPFAFGLILCAMRSFGRETSPYFARLLDVLAMAPRRETFAAASLEMARGAVALRDAEGLPVTGFDLAGEEAGFPAGDHRAAYAYAHSHFLRKTVHAGEAYGPESIFQAITDCHANRIGHGTFLFAHERIRDPRIADPARYCEQLAEYIANQRITIEVCLTSNLQTVPSLRAAEDHPAGRMIARNLSVSICTDNRLVSDTTVTTELERVVRLFRPTAAQFRNLVIAGFKGSFYPGTYTEKRAFVRRAIERYERLEGRRAARAAGETPA